MATRIPVELLDELYVLYEEDLDILRQSDPDPQRRDAADRMLRARIATGLRKNRQPE